MALGGDGRVLVDKGYINMECTSTGLNPYGPGVRVRTRKVAHVKGLSPYAQAKFLCICGYAYPPPRCCSVRPWTWRTILAPTVRGMAIR